MKKVYILYNWDSNEVIAVSEDRDLINEIMCDAFMDDVEYQWYWDLSWSAYEIEELSERARMIWDDMLEWYDEYIGVYEEDVI